MTTQSPSQFVEHTPVNGSWAFFDVNGTLELRGGNSTHTLTKAGMTNSTWMSLAGTITGTSGVLYINASSTSWDRGCLYRRFKRP